MSTATSYFDLDTKLIDFTDKSGSTSWTIRNAVEGVQVFGGIGSGKTSGSGKMLALKYLENGFGGLVLTAKHDEKELWQQYCKAANRSNDLLIVEPNEKNYFNFLEYESQVVGDRSITENIVQVLKTVIRASEEKSKGKSDDPFWETALDMLIANTIDLCLLAYGKVSVELLYTIAQSVFSKEELQNLNKIKANPDRKKRAFELAFDTARDNIEKQVKAWEERQDQDWLNALDSMAYEQAVCDALPQARNFKFVDEFFIESFINISEKTRAIIDFSFIGFLNSLIKDPVFSLFCRHKSTFTPEQCLEGKIILICLPVKEYHKVGRDSQIMFKYIWQRAMERRKVKENGRPVFLWADEAQHFLHEYDAEYQATARSSRIATVYISQNLPNYYANMGGEKSEYKVKSFLGTLSTKIFHANADIETNKYASELIGEGYQREESEATTSVDGKMSVTQTVSSKLEKMVRPEEFGALKTGGPQNEFLVSGYIHIQGKQFPNKFNYRKIVINQNSNSQ